MSAGCLAETAALFDRLTAGDLSGGWRPVSGQVAAFWLSQSDRATAVLDLTVPAAPERLLAVIQDPGASGLAGNLLHWESTAIEPDRWRLRYIVGMPWPLQRRVFTVQTSRHSDGESLWLLARQDPTPWDADGQPCILHRSDYRLRPVPDGCHFQRIISLDLKLALPGGLVGWLLGREQLADAARLSSL